MKDQQPSCSLVCAGGDIDGMGSRTSSLLDVPTQAWLSSSCLQVVDGNRLINTLYDITFKQDKEHTVLCSKQLTQSEVAKFRKVT